MDDLNELTSSLTTSVEDLKRRSASWLANVRILAESLHRNFNKFMKELEYEGEVGLVEKGGFGDYEMQMRVRFRREALMSELSGQRHSGGERAVATIMYLMALQTETDSPFRVVDEINQGMDERNERLVFDRIVQSCCGTDAHKRADEGTGTGEVVAIRGMTSSSSVATVPRTSKKRQVVVAEQLSSSVGGEGGPEATHRPQYFLVSPKLLQGLRAMDHPDVTVLMVWNGPGVLSKWQLPCILEGVRKRYRVSDPVTEVEDDRNVKIEVGAKGGVRSNASSHKRMRVVAG